MCWMAVLRTRAAVVKNNELKSFSGGAARYCAGRSWDLGLGEPLERSRISLWDHLNSTNMHIVNYLTLGCPATLNTDVILSTLNTRLLSTTDPVITVCWCDWIFPYGASHDASRNYVQSIHELWTAMTPGRDSKIKNQGHWRKLQLEWIINFVVLTRQEISFWRLSYGKALSSVDKVPIVKDHDGAISIWYRPPGLDWNNNCSCRSLSGQCPAGVSVDIHHEVNEKYKLRSSQLSSRTQSVSATQPKSRNCPLRPPPALLISIP